jgi:hypothetical protein
MSSAPDWNLSVGTIFVEGTILEICKLQAFSGQKTQV